MAKIIFPAILTADDWRKITPCDVLLVCHDHDRGYVFQGRLYAQLLDSFGELVTRRGLKTCTVATPFSRAVKNKAFGSPHVANRIYLREQIRLKLRDHLPGVSVKKDGQDTLLWQCILQLAKPRVVVAIQPGHDLCRAGKAMSIPVFDLQHGLIDDDSPYYSEKHQGLTDIMALPSGFLCWDEHNARILKDWVLSRGITVHVIGQPWFNRFIYKNIHDQLVNEALNKFRLPKKENMPTILVSLQWGMHLYSHGHITNRVMPSALEKVIKDTSGDIRWLLRLHPIQLFGEEASICRSYLIAMFSSNDNVMWDQVSQMPLPIVLSLSDLHLTFHSSITIEATWMGLRSGLLNPELNPGGKVESYYTHERSLGMAEVVQLEPDSILYWIQTALSKGKLPPAFQDYEQNLNEFLDYICRIPRPAIPAQAHK